MTHTLKETLNISQFSLTSTSDIIARKAALFQVSQNGFYLRVHRKELEKTLRKHLNLDSICNKNVDMYLPKMNLNLDGTVIYAKHVGSGVFELFIKFLDTLPSYWCDCLMDMLVCYPEGEFSQIDLLSSSKLSR